MAGGPPVRSGGKRDRRPERRRRLKPGPQPRGRRKRALLSAPPGSFQPGSPCPASPPVPRSWEPVGPDLERVVISVLAGLGPGGDRGEPAVTPPPPTRLCSWSAQEGERADRGREAGRSPGHPGQATRVPSWLLPLCPLQRWSQTTALLWEPGLSDGLSVIVTSLHAAHSSAGGRLESLFKRRRGSQKWSGTPQNLRSGRRGGIPKHSNKQTNKTKAISIIVLIWNEKRKKERKRKKRTKQMR